MSLASAFCHACRCLGRKRSGVATPWAALRPAQEHPHAAPGLPDRVAAEVSRLCLPCPDRSGSVLLERTVLVQHQVQRLLPTSSDMRIKGLATLHRFPTHRNSRSILSKHTLTAVTQHCACPRFPRSAPIPAAPYSDRARMGAYWPNSLRQKFPTGCRPAIGQRPELTTSQTFTLDALPPVAIFRPSFDRAME